jgi:hypothetical protein
MKFPRVSIQKNIKINVIISYLFLPDSTESRRIFPVELCSVRMFLRFTPNNLGTGSKARGSVVD